MMGVMTPFQFDMALQAPVFYMERRGIRIDKEQKKRFAEEAHEDWAKNQANLDTIAGRVLNVNSPKQIQAYFYNKDSGLGVRPRTKRRPGTRKTTTTADEDALRSIMAEAAAKHKILIQDKAKLKQLRIFLSARLLLNIRGTRKILSSYTGCPDSCGCNKPSVISFDDDSRMRCNISVGGTETMRFSHSKTLWGTGLNLATVPHKLRRMFVADEGYELGEFDLNRGESWVYAFLSMDPELVRILTNGVDFHAETAAAIQGAFGQKGLTADEIARKAKEGDEGMYKLRYLGKKVNHASAYRMGPFRGAEVVNVESDDTGITITPSQMGKAQKLWKQKYFGIQNWWDDIDCQIENHRRLVTPYGRVREFFGFMSDQLKKEATAAVPQSTSVDYLNYGMLRVYNELVVKKVFGLELLHQNHDSILTQWPIQHRDDIIPEIIESLESTVRINDHVITIPVEATYGQNWGDYHPEKNPEGLREWTA